MAAAALRSPFPLACRGAGDIGWAAELPDAGGVNGRRTNVMGKAGAAGADIGLYAGRMACARRHGWPLLRGGLLTLASVVALAGCGDPNETARAKPEGSADTPKSAGDAPAEERKPEVDSKPARKKLIKLDRQVKSGKFATAAANGTVKTPELVLLSIKATPPQKVQATWSLTCTNGKRAGTEDGLRNLRSPVSMPLRRPVKNSESCVVAANAQLTKSGQVILKLATRSR